MKTVNRPTSEGALSNFEAYLAGESIVDIYRREMERRRKEKESRRIQEKEALARMLKKDWGYIRFLCEVIGDDLSGENYSNDCNVRA